MNRIPEPVSGPLEYASDYDPNSWRQGAGALGVFALFIGVFRAALSALWAVQGFGPRIGLVRPRALYSHELWIGGLHVAALLCSILLVCGAAAFLTRRRGGSLIALAALLLAILSIVTGASRAVFETSNYGRGAPIPFYVLTWAAVRASEGLLEGTFHMMLAWAFVKMEEWRKEQKKGGIPVTPTYHT